MEDLTVLCLRSYLCQVLSTTWRGIGIRIQELTGSFSHSGSGIQANIFRELCFRATWYQITNAIAITMLCETYSKVYQEPKMKVYSDNTDAKCSIWAASLYIWTHFSRICTVRQVYRSAFIFIQWCDNFFCCIVFFMIIKKERKILLKTPMF